MRRRFAQVDVFSDSPGGGNPVAVVLDGEGLSDETMQRFASWTNLSETTFVLAPTQPGADYRVRIFTPTEELPFAGHPTLGTCHAIGFQKDHVVQECGVGLVELRRAGGRWAFAAPPLTRSGPVEEAELRRMAELLELPRAAIVDAEWCDNGPGWMGLLLEDAAAVLALRPPRADVYVGVIGPGGAADWEVRTFFAAGGYSVEDPVTGSFNASAAQWLLRTGRATAPYVAAQGTALGRTGRIHISQDAQGAVWVGGATATLVDGHVALT